LPFDRILTINDTLFVGKDMEQNNIMKHLRGIKNSTVKLGIKRRNIADLISVEVTRGDVPVKSVDAAYQVSNGTGLIKVSRFTRTTYNEFMNAIAQLKSEGCNSFIIDLRDNPGGIMEAATYMANEFLHEGQLIVYTEGKSVPRQDLIADGTGTCIESPVIVLTNEGSASASEIFAGAIQDNDRGIIIGRRTFGKGLVQTRFPLYDGSQLQLTIARYYTPSGRSIQKKYELGHTDDYDMDIYNRYVHGEFYSADSIKTDSLPAYRTLTGRTVYGGGGIIPDVFIPSDTVGITSYFNNVTRNSNVLYLYALDYSDRNRDILETFTTWKQLYDYLEAQPLVNDFTDFAADKGIHKRPALIQISSQLIRTYLEAYIGRNFLDDSGFYPILFLNDPVVRKAVATIEEDKADPSVQANS
jgi:carboxyl-terminal processing protease